MMTRTGHFEILTLPTLIVFVGGQPVKRRTVAGGGKSRLVAGMQEFLSAADMTA